jgi:hypothetical protein
MVGAAGSTVSDPNFIVALYVFIIIALPASVAGLFVFRGAYYKQLPGKVQVLEAALEGEQEANKEQEKRTQAALKRQARELEMWKGVATQTPEIKKLLELYEKHDEEASERYEELVTGQSDIKSMHTEILSVLVRLEKKLT